MRLKGKKRQLVYKWFKFLFESEVGTEFKFETGEKKRVRQIFTHVAEQMGIRDEERFDEVLDCFQEYVSGKRDEWLKWDKATRNNYIGFMDKPEEIAIFVSGREKKKQQETSIAGTESEDDWDF